MRKFYHATGFEKLSAKTNAIMAEVEFDKYHGYILRVRAVELEEYCFGYVYSPEYYNFYYDEVCLLDKVSRRGAKAEERANNKAKEIVKDIVDKYISRAAALSGVTPVIIDEEEWR